MVIKTEQKGNELYVFVAGGIQDSDTPEFKEILNQIAEEPFDTVIFDFSEVHFICSASIGRMLLFYKKMRLQNRQMKVCGVSRYLYQLFEFIHPDLLFPIERYAKQ
jgi:anti-anti-sigma factor